MPRFFLELALFFKTRLDSFWLNLILNWSIKRVRDEYIDYKIDKYQRDNSELKRLLEHERIRRRLLAKK